MLVSLERRLDNVVFRLGLAPTIPAARQLIVHGHVRVNAHRVDKPAFITEHGQVIALTDGIRGSAAALMGNSVPRIHLYANIRACYAGALDGLTHAGNERGGPRQIVPGTDE